MSHHEQLEADPVSARIRRKTGGEILGTLIGGALALFVGLAVSEWALPQGLSPGVQVLLLLFLMALGAVGGWHAATLQATGKHSHPVLHPQLRELIRQQGTQLWEQPTLGQQMVRRALSATPQQANYLCQALALGVVARLQAHLGDPPSELLRGQAGQLVLLAGMKRVDALWVVCTWSRALGQRLQLQPTAPGQLSPTTGRDSVEEYLRMWLVDLLVMGLSFGCLVGFFAVMVDNHFLNGFFLGLAIMAAAVLGVGLLRLGLFGLRVLLYEWFALDRDVKRTQHTFGLNYSDEDADP